MKIKEVCEKTCLTARTIRLYTEEKLISPQYSENYLGRKTFDFSDKDVKSLLDIATLRKYGFSITEIRKIIETKENSAFIINDICNRKQKTVQEEKSMLSVLLQLNNGKNYTIEEISLALNSQQEIRTLPDDDTISLFLLLLKDPKKLIKKLLVIVDKLLFILSFIAGIFFIVYYFTEWKYPHFTDITKGLLYLFLTSVPAVFIFMIWIYTKSQKQNNPKGKVKSGSGFISFIIILISVFPIMFIGLIRPVESFTTDMKNYRQIDENQFNISENSFYNELFPQRPKGAVRKGEKTIYPESDYFYRCKATFDYTVDIYAEWSLDEKDFYKEIDRVKKLYSAYEILDMGKNDYKYTVIKKENYVCLIRYDGEIPFDQEKNNYCYFIFAYDENNLRVRYVLCCSKENGTEQPYYLELDW